MTTTWLLLALVATTQAVPVLKTNSLTGNNKDNTGRCASKCFDSDNNAGRKFSYQPGTTYVYNYDVETENSMFGTPMEKARLSVKSTAEIEVTSVCEFNLHLKDIKISHSDGSVDRLIEQKITEELRQSLETKTRFSFNDGTISEICPSNEDNTWSLNFKRGLLSAFQNSMVDTKTKKQKVKETDISGVCETHYEITPSMWSSSIHVNKSKDLLACTQRDNLQSVLQTVPYYVPSEIQSIPLIKSSYKCDISIGSDKIVDSSKCEESYLFVPFSNKQSGGRTIVTQTLTFANKKSSGSIASTEFQAGRSLLFEHSGSAATTEDQVSTLNSKLREICQQTQSDVRPETPRLFSEIVVLMKGLSLSQLDQVYSPPDTCRQFFLDALPMAGSTGAVQMMVKMMINKEVSPFITKTWLNYFFFVKNTTLDMVESVITLLEGDKDLVREAKLPMASLVSMYCRSHAGCDTNDKVSKLVEILAAPIGSYCSVDQSNIDEILLNLRALGNLNLDTSSTLDKCLLNPSVALEVRVAAVDAYRRIPCLSTGTKKTSSLWRTLRDVNSEVEVRVSAYLAVMRCPDEVTLTEVARFVNAEAATSQLGGYIYSHLSNLRDTSDPHKQEVARAVSRLNLKKFDLTFMKNPRNFETSVLLNKYNLGAVLEADLITSNDSSIPLPRSSHLNLTAELFGQSINILEIGARQEGLGQLLEETLAASPLFASQRKTSRPRDGINAAVFARVFGNEMMYHRFSEAQLKQAPEDLMRLLFDAKPMSVKHNQKIIDVAMTIPTGAGLPLNININGSTTLDISIQGKTEFDIKTWSLVVDGEIRPSMATEISGSMMIDAFTAQLGQSMRNTLHSSTQLKTHVTLDNDNQFTLEIYAPQDKMEIFQARSQFFVRHNTVEREQAMIEDNYRTLAMCTGPTVGKVFGVQLCSEVKYPNASHIPDAPHFPLTGPSSVSVTFNMVDQQKKILVHAKKVQTDKGMEMQVLLNTPGSKVNRHFQVDLLMETSPNRRLNLALQCPWVKASFDTAVISTNELHSLSGTLLVNDKDKYSVTAEVKVESEGGRRVVTPLLQVTHRGQTNNLLSGQVELLAQRKLEFDLQVMTFARFPVILKGLLANQRKEKRAKLTLTTNGKEDYTFDVGSTFQFSGKQQQNWEISPVVEVRTPTRDVLVVRGSARRTHTKFSSEVKVNAWDMTPVSIAMSTSRVDKENSVSYDVDGKVKSVWISAGLDSSVILKNSENLIVKVKGDYDLMRLSGNSFVWNSRLTDRSKNLLTRYSVKTSLSNTRYPEYNTGARLDLKYKQHLLDTSLDLNYGRNHRDNNKVINLHAVLNTPSYSDLKVKLSAKAPEKKIDLALNLDHSATESGIDSSLNLKMKPILKDDFAISMKLKNESLYYLNAVCLTRINMFGKTMTIRDKLDTKTPEQIKYKAEIIDFDQKVHTVETSFGKPSPSRYFFDAKLQMADIKPFEIHSKFDLGRMKMSGSFSHEETYSLDSSLHREEGNVRYDLDLKHPERHIKTVVSAAQKDYNLQSRFFLNMNAAKKNTKNNAIDLEGKLSMPKFFSIISGEFSIKTPFRGYENYNTAVKYVNDEEKYSLSGKVASSDSKVSGNLVAEKPVSLSHLRLNLNANTPLKLYRKVGLDVTHDLRANPVKTIVKVSVNKDVTVLRLKGERTSTRKAEHIGGLISFTTPYKPSRDVKITFQNKMFQGKMHGAGALFINGDKYATNYAIDQSHNRNDLNHGGQLTYSWPSDQVNVDWSLHKLGLGMENIKSYLKIQQQNNNENLLKANLDFSQKIADWNLHQQGLVIIKWPGDGFNLKWKHNNTGLHSVQSVVTTYMNSDKDKQVKVNLGMNRHQDGQEVEDSGKLVVVVPDDRFVANWKHKVTGSSKVKSVLDWQVKSDDNKRIHLELSAKNSSNRRNSNLKGKMVLDAPWVYLNKVGMELDYDGSQDKEMVNLETKVRNKVTSLVSFTVDNSDNKHHAEFELLTPLSPHKISGKETIVFREFPISTSASLSWSPRSRVVVEGSLNAASVSDMSVNAKLSTPFSDFETMSLVGTHRMKNGDIATAGHLMFKEEKIIDFENTIHNEELFKTFKTKLVTPFTMMTLLDAGFLLDSRRDGFVSKAHLELQPITNSMQAEVDIAKDYLNGRIEMSVPQQKLTYFTNWKYSIAENGIKGFEASLKPVGTWPEDYYMRFKINGKAFKHAHVTLHVPDDVNEELNGYGVSVAGSPVQQGFQSGLKLYTNKISSNIGFAQTELNVKINVDWQEGIVCNLVVDTPFENYKQNVISFSQNADNDHFNTKVNVQIEKDAFSGEVDFLNKYDEKNVTLKLNSVYKGKVSKFESSGMIAGDIKDLKGNVEIILNNDVIRSSLTNKMSLGKVYRMKFDRDESSSVKTNFQLNTPYTKDLSLTINYFMDLTEEDQTFNTDIFAQHGAQTYKNNIQLVNIPWEKLKLNLTLTNPLDSSQSTNVRLDASSNLSQEARFQWVGKLLAEKDGVQLMTADLELYTEPSGDFHTSVETAGEWMPKFVVKVDHNIEVNSFKTVALVSISEENNVNMEVTWAVEETKVNVNADVKLRLYGVPNKHQLQVVGEKSGKKLTGNVVYVLNNHRRSAELEYDTSDKFVLKAKVEGLMDRDDVVGVHVEHARSSDTLDFGSKIILSRREELRVKVNFYMDDSGILQASTEVITPYKGYEMTKVNSRINLSTKSRLSSSLNIEYAHNKIINYDLIIKLKPTPNLFLNIKTPFVDYKDVTLAGELDSTHLNISLNVNSAQYFTAEMTFDKNSKMKITTPLNVLKEVELVLTVVPRLPDWSVQIKADSNGRQVNGRVVLVETPGEAPTTTLSAELTGLSEPITLILNYQNNPARLMNTSLDLLIGHQQYVHLNMTAKSSPVEGLQSVHFLSVKPWPVEFAVESVTVGQRRQQSLIVKSNSRRLIKLSRVETEHTEQGLRSMTGSYVMACHHQKIRIETLLKNSSTKFYSLGKLFYGPRSKRPVFYEIDVERKESSSGKVKLGLPSRTLALSGALRKTSSVTEVQGHLGWDVDRDASQAVSFHSSVDRSQYTRGNLSLSLPGDLHMDNAVTYQPAGEVMFECQTDISYSRRPSQTFTFFSRVRDVAEGDARRFPRFSWFQQVESQGFNYSMEIGVKHPQTHLDISLDSHVGQRGSKVSSGVGLHYLSSEQQKKNIALWLEIDQLKKTIDILTKSPNKELQVVASVKSQSPLSLSLVKLTDGKTTFNSNLNLDKDLTAASLQLGEDVAISARYPNATALLAEVTKGSDKAADFSAILTSARLFHTSVHWSPATLTHLQSAWAQGLADESLVLTQMFDDLSVDMNVEMKKVRAIESSSHSAVQPMLQLVRPGLALLADQCQGFLQQIFSSLHLSHYSINPADFLSKLYNWSEATVSNVAQSLRITLNKLHKFSLVDLLREEVNNLVGTLEEYLDYCIDTIDSANKKLKENVQLLSGFAQNCLQQLKDQVPDLLNFDLGLVIEWLANFDLNNMADVRDAIALLPQSLQSSVGDIIIEVYSEVKSALALWTDRDTMKSTLHSLLNKMAANLMSEVSKVSASVAALTRNPVTVYAPQRGDIEAEILLPGHPTRLELRSLWETLETFVENITRLLQNVELPSVLSGRS